MATPHQSTTPHQTKNAKMLKILNVKKWECGTDGAAHQKEQHRKVRQFSC